ncbi:MAG TPA: nicotinate-nucleotide adenylyltransferase [Xanthomonadales bacterium]|nr:nicotinate-nucleotide adenylyltransferase [Xanthomonadales bacterium]
MIGIFGGTFDPVHFGHLRAASEALEALPLANLRLLPAGQPPHRSLTFAPAEHRLAMLELALQNQPDLIADDREVRRTGHSFMVDTLRVFREQAGNSPLLLLIGQDAANKLDTWHQWQRLFELAHIVIMRRPDSKHVYSGQLFREVQPRLVSDVQALGETCSGRVLPLEVTQLAISSTRIRSLIAAGRTARFLLPEPVIRYIDEKGLYRED